MRLRHVGRPLLALLTLGIGIGLGLGVARALLLPSATVRAAEALRVGPDFVATARQATPAVVNISALQVVRAQRSPYSYDPFFQFFGHDLPFRTPIEERKTSLGSGVLISSDGVIVTNHHVVEHARQIAVTTADRQRYRASLLGSDPATDIAVIRIEAPGLPFLGWGDSARCAVGEYVLAIGNPFQLNQTVTMGIISATGRSNVGIVDYEDFIQTDAAINPGNSGGALVNARGELIGINTAIYSETGGYQGIGFAVPSNLARPIAAEILAHGRIARGWLGITQIRSLDEQTARLLGLKPGPGAVVLELLRGSPADRAGLAPGDLVLSVAGVAVEDAAQLRNVIASAKVGSTLTMVVLREGQRRELRVPVLEQPNRDN